MNKRHILWLLLFAVAFYFAATLDASTPLLVLSLMLFGVMVLMKFPQWAFPLAIMATPLSFYWFFDELAAGLSLPAEPLLVFLTLLFLLQTLMGKRIIATRHPVTILLAVNLIWMFIGVFFSQLPSVSLKYVLAQSWFIIPMFFLGTVVFNEKRTRQKAIWWYVLPLMLVIVYTTLHHAQFGFGELASKRVMQPFYNDHTAYGAVTALFIPLLSVWTADGTSSKKRRLLSLVALIFLLLALFLSASRAAWLSVFVALMSFVILKFKIRWYVLAGLTLVTLSFLGLFRTQIVDYLSKNEDVSSSDITQHIKSMANISTDVSNLERLNRWESAWLMTKARPLTGFGPGTYMFEYAPFQRSSSKTVISTNFGEVGNAHSEYIGPLAERGVPGMLLVVALFLSILYTGQQVWKHADNKQDKQLALGLLLGLVTYMTHGFLNNFLDTDKLAIPFWMFTAMLVAMHVSIKKHKTVSRP
ncbi:MAG: O-antigen ligase family protein [Cryomorphaceae bacterium]|nr:O-antigen ligase family protein [Cryomorphaceae bacterium]